jgi:hypothetical protein
VKKIIVLLCTFFYASLGAQKADLIIFSFDRPLQLYALLESTERYIKNLGDIQVIYRSSNERYTRAYQEVFHTFPSVISVKQGDHPKADFKPNLLQSFMRGSHAYIIFAVDDIVVCDSIDLAQCIDALEKSGSYGFYLRLGKNITYNYMLNKKQPLPPLAEWGKDMYTWTFAGSALQDWAYPNTVDMTLYRKKDIKDDLQAMDYETPNRLEFVWWRDRKKVMQKKGICFEHSKIVNLPLNKVQKDFTFNRDAESLSPEELLDLFERGFKMDIAPLRNVRNISAHMAYAPTFIIRN